MRPFPADRRNHRKRASMPVVNRRSLLAGSMAMFAGSALADDRQAIIEAARKEGRLALAHTVSAPKFPSFMDAFSRAYPFLDVSSGLYSAPTGRVLARVDAELKADSLTFDVLHVASLAPYLTLEK